MRKLNGLAIELGVNFLLPWLIYRLARPQVGSTTALILSALPALIWGLAQFLRFRRVDALSALVLLGIVLSLLVMALGGSPRLLLLRESLVSGAIGIVFLLSLAARRPLIFYLGRATVAREMEGGADRFEMLWREQPGFAASIRLMTLVWGLGLTGENALRSWLAWTWPIERFLLISPIISYGIYGALVLWTLWYRKRMKQLGSLQSR